MEDRNYTSVVMVDVASSWVVEEEQMRGTSSGGSSTMASWESLAQTPIVNIELIVEMLDTDSTAYTRLKNKTILLRLRIGDDMFVKMLNEITNTIISYIGKQTIRISSNRITGNKSIASIISAYPEILLIPSISDITLSKRLAVGK